MKNLIVTLVLILVSIFLSWAGSDYGESYNGIPTFTLCVAAAFVINWLAFIPAYIFQTEKFYDLTGSVTYLTLTIVTLILHPANTTVTYILAALVIIWSLRLGTFLFTRIHRTGQDDRFDHIKPNFIRFFNAWGIQALWVVLTAAPVYIVLTSSVQAVTSIYTYVGLAIWILGFGIEVVADHQKSTFRKNPDNKGQFIQSGLWSKSRHPNYFGEIVLWLGVTIIAFPILKGWQHIALISPLFVTFLLTRVSGIPMLEDKADKKWGDQKDYISYKKNTPALIPKI